MISKVHAKANNKFLKSNDPNKPTLYICIYIYIYIYIHIYILRLTLIIYMGTSMIQLFLLLMLDWVDLEKNKFDNFHDDGPIGYFVEVNLDYPHKLHDLYNDYLLADFILAKLFD